MRSKSKVEAERIFEKQDARPWLTAYGCPASSQTYWQCLQMLSVEDGLQVEARRAQATISGMVDIAALAAGPRTFELNLDWLLPNRFNDTVSALVRWLGASSSEQERAQLVARSHERCFGAAKVLNMATQMDLNPSQHVVSSTSAKQVEMRRAVEGGISGHVRELSARSGLRNFTPPPLFKAASYDSLVADTSAATGTGIVHCTAPHLLTSTLKVLKHLRGIGCTLSVEAWNVMHELSPRNVSHLQALKGVRVRDLREVLSAQVASDTWEVAALRGFMCKLIALLASDFDEIILVDHDSMFFSSPTSLLRSSVFLQTGMLMFRDRVKRSVSGAPLKDPPRYLRTLIRRRLGWKGALKTPQRPGHAKTSLPLLPWPWRPSSKLLGSPMASGESAHFIDSSVLLLSKRRAPLVVATLYRLHELYRHELYANLHGDKETYWIACELVGGLSCGVSRFLTGEMGALKHCLIGNLLQFNPDDGSPVHCNCKRANYTHVSRPVDITRNESWGDQLLSVVASPLQPEHPLQLVFSIPTGQTSTWRKKLCTRRTQVEDVATFLRHNQVPVPIRASLCAIHNFCVGSSNG